MSDPMSSLDTMSQLTRLVATHGIYALFVIFMFYQQRRARLNLRDCKAVDRPYFQRQTTIVLWTTIALCALVAMVWIYSTFFFQPKVFVEGTIKDLTERPARPVNVGDPPMLLHRVAAFRDDVNFYSAERPSLESDSFDLDWAMVLPDSGRNLQLVFQKSYFALEAVSSDQALAATPGHEELTPKIKEGVLRKRVNVNLDRLGALRRQRIHLVYRPDPVDGIAKLGTLYMVDDDDHSIPIPWAEDAAGPQRSELALPRGAGLFGTGVAWAQPKAQRAFGAGGEVRPDVADRIGQYLQSDRLEEQLAAQRTLIENGEASLRLIEKLLQDESGDQHARSLLVHNLASVVVQLVAAGAAANPSLSLVFAESLFALNDYELAASFFLKVPGSYPLPEGALLHRGVAYLETRRYDAALKDFDAAYARATSAAAKSLALTNAGAAYSRENDLERAADYLVRAVDLDPKSLTAQFNLGLVELQRGKLEAAERAFRRADKLNPENATARIHVAVTLQRQGELAAAAEILESIVDKDPRDPRALNNLSYVYVLRGDNLSAALSFAERAIKLGGDDPSYLDTKGLILHKMGRTKEGLDYLERALAGRPGDLVIKNHLEEARKTSAAGH